MEMKDRLRVVRTQHWNKMGQIARFQGAALYMAGEGLLNPKMANAIQVECNARKDKLRESHARVMAELKQESKLEK